MSCDFPAGVAGAGHGGEAVAPGPPGLARYLREFGTCRRPLAAAFVGMGSGYTINNYTNNVFIPPLMQAFGWSSADIAMAGAAAMLSIVFQPLAGRITDRFGVRPVALFGTIAAASVFMLFSLMTGSFDVFLGLVMLQIALVASTTGAVVFSRPIAGSFHRARGLAPSVAICAPSLAGALAVPWLSAYVEQHGWRSGYHICAAATLVLGLLAVWLVPPHSGMRGIEPPEPAADRAAPERPSRPAVPAALRSRAMRIILCGMVLCSLSISLQTTQLKVVLLATGLSGARASALISVYAVGVLLGRLLSGLALDLLPTRFVAFAAMSLPGVGLLVLASGSTAPALLVLAMLTLGLSLGAEGDIAGFLVMRYFPQRVYSMTLGLVIGAIALASGLGGILLGTILGAFGSFTPFLALAGGSAIAGGAMFLGLSTPAPSGAGGFGEDSAS